MNTALELLSKLILTLIAGFILLFLLGCNMYLFSYLSGGMLLKLMNEVVIPLYDIPPLPLTRLQVTGIFLTKGLFLLIWKAGKLKKSELDKVEGKEKLIKAGEYFAGGYATLGVTWVVMEVVVWILQ